MKVNERIAREAAAADKAAKAKAAKGDSMAKAVAKGDKIKANERLVAEFRAKVRAHFAGIAPVIELADKVRTAQAWRVARDGEGNPYRSWDAFFAAEFGALPEIPVSMRDDVAAKLGARGMSAANIGRITGVSKATAARIVRAAKAKAEGREAPANNPGRDKAAKAAKADKADAPKAVSVGDLADALGGLDPAKLSDAEFTRLWESVRKFADKATKAGKLKARAA